MGGKNIWIVFLTCALTTGCGVDIFGLSSDKLTQDYEIGYIDTNSMRTIWYDGSILIPPCVFEVGWNENFIIAKQTKAESDDNTVNYYIIDIAKNKNMPGKKHHREGVFGPFSESDFVKKRIELGVPQQLDFSKNYKGCE